MRVRVPPGASQGRYMKNWIIGGLMGAVFAALLIVTGLSIMAATQAGHGYTCTTTSVTSATTPVAVATPGYETTFILHTESGAAVAARIFPYVGTLPTAAPSPAAYMEIPPGAFFPDAITCNAPDCRFAIGQGWAAVLATGVTAINVDECGR